MFQSHKNENNKMNERKTFFASDHHFFHANIIKYANRPFNNIWSMNETLIERHNSVVTSKDIVYFVGDFAFTSDEDEIINILKRLNGEKHFVAGNHDKGMFKDSIMKQFQSFSRSPFKEIYVQDADARGGKQSITLCHYALRVWNKSHHGAFHLYGHSHGSLPDDPNSRSFDIGVDCWDFTPVSYDKVKKVMAKKNWKPIDHHGAD